MAKGGGGVDATPNKFFQYFSEMERAFFAKLNFICRHILGTSVHEKNSQIGPTVLALKLDKGRVLESGNHPPPPLSLTFLCLFF